ncbi:MAG: TIGR04551 family protein [Deltaproteobacteria bacterium]|nr:TIGR04551 family protein [Deltaproteobacteria bacterium]
MIRFSRPLSAALALAVAISPLGAFAQVAPGGMPGGGTMGEEEAKPEGVAEQAPKEKGQLPTTPVLPPWPGESRKRLQLFELDGYFRFRTDWFKNLHLGFHQSGDESPPFREPLSCLDTATDDVKSFCSKNIGSANMRLRLEPIFHLSEQVTVRSQIDVLDNVVLGSTPEGFYTDGTTRPQDVPANVLSHRQVPPEEGRNYVTDSIRAKRAWAEIMTALGLLKFGRMPSHWGLGILENGGAEDTYHETYCLDCDFGDTVDRLVFSAKIPGSRFRLALAKDWPATGLTTAHTPSAKNREGGQPFDLDDKDDVHQWVLVLANLDSLTKWKDVIERGDLALNYGFYLIRRTQDLDTSVDASVVAGNLAQPERALVTRRASAWIPDAYFRLGYKKLNVEGEGVLVWGDIDSLKLSDTLEHKDLELRQLGFVVRANYLFLDDDLNLGMEVGFASGDQWESTRPSGAIHVRESPSIPQSTADNLVSNFRFDPDFHVDLILFRELLGTVTNATYVKPSMAYHFTKSFVLKAAAITSFAHRSVATPGNSTWYGLEFDGDLGYQNEAEGFFAGMSYGVFFPGGAMDHKEGLPGFLRPGEAGTAQTFQTRLVVKF